MEKVGEVEKEGLGVVAVENMVVAEDLVVKEDNSIRQIPSSLGYRN